MAGIFSFTGSESTAPSEPTPCKPAPTEPTLSEPTPERRAVPGSVKCLAAEPMGWTGLGVRIRHFTKDDANRQRLWPLYADPLLESYSLRLFDEDSVQAYWHNLLTRTDYFRFSVDRLDAGDSGSEFVGTLSLRDLMPGRPVSRLGIVFRADSLNRGLGRRALMVFLDGYFRKLGFNALELDVAAVNARAIRCYQSVGFRWNGRHWQTVEVATDQVHRIGHSALYPQYFRVQSDQVWVLHYDMIVTRDTAASAGVDVSQGAR